jgi:ABC-type transport system involved in Fe-S cluster assembly fused permease/ATPase subunit
MFSEVFTIRAQDWRGVYASAMRDAQRQALHSQGDAVSDSATAQSFNVETKSQPDRRDAMSG